MLVILIGKLCIKLLNIFGSSATALPGLIILKLYPRFLEETIGKHPDRIILVTGTNGKTTTAHLLVHLLRKSGKRVFHNPEGSNMERGVASAILKHNHLNFDFFVLESDEGTFPNLLYKLKPKAVILLNIFRDQLDRYGEINSLMTKWLNGLKTNLPETIIFNADDPNVTKIIKSLKIPSSLKSFEWASKIKNCGFSVKKQNDASSQRELHNADSAFCPHCNNILRFVQNDFYCENCGFKKIEPKYVLGEKDGGLFITGGGCDNEPLGMPVTGKFNYYNLAAAAAAFDTVGDDFYIVPKRDRNGILSLRDILSDFTPAFGRFQKIKHADKFFYVILAKNPAGMDNVLKTIFSENMMADNLMMCLNDKIADGEDVSWIYDVDYEGLFVPDVEMLHPPSSKTSDGHSATSLRILLSGTRGYDLALRLKIAEKLPETCTIEPNIQIAFELFLENIKTSKISVVVATYMCLLELQKIMFKKGMVKKIM